MLRAVGIVDDGWDLLTHLSGVEFIVRRGLESTVRHALKELSHSRMLEGPVRGRPTSMIQVVIHQNLLKRDQAQSYPSADRPAREPPQHWFEALVVTPELRFV